MLDEPRILSADAIAIEPDLAVSFFLRCEWPYLTAGLAELSAGRVDCLGSDEVGLPEQRRMHGPGRACRWCALPGHAVWRVNFEVNYLTIVRSAR
jgi:hypothetical protein